MHRSAIVLLLLAAAACAHAAEEVKSSPMFDNWMFQRTSPKVHSAGYRDIETEHVCLIPKSKENCRSLGCGVGCNLSPYYQTPVACCGHPVREGPLDFFAERPTIGRCKWEENLFDTPIINKEGKAEMQLLGKFTVECDMNEDSEKCNDALCDGMKLIGMGEIMTYSHVAFVGVNADAAPLTCAGPLTPPIAKSTAKIQYAHDEEARHIYQLGLGRIYMGGFKVVSHLQPAKFQAGKIQLAYPVNAGALIQDDELPNHDYFITRNGRIELEFIKSEAH